MQTITQPTTLRPVLIARLLERQRSPLAALAEEIFDLAIAYRIDAAFALAQWMVESQLGCLPLAQAHRNAGLVRLALTRMAAPGAAGETRPILPLRYGDAMGSGYISYPGWLAGLDEYFRLLRCVFVDAWHKEQVEQVARLFLETTPGRPTTPAPNTPRAGGDKAATWRNRRGKKAARAREPLVSPQEIAAYAERVERYRAEFQAGG